MVLFRPDLVIFSAGFDAHDEDPLANCELTEEDFTWATEIGVCVCVCMFLSFFYILDSAIKYYSMLFYTIPYHTMLY